MYEFRWNSDVAWLHQHSNLILPNKATREPANSKKKKKEKDKKGDNTCFGTAKSCTGSPVSDLVGQNDTHVSQSSKNGSIMY